MTIRKLLVANRGEIAVRIISTARELGLDVFALYSENDASHTFGLSSSNIIKLPSPAAFLNIDEIIVAVQSNNIDAVHPGYGFLSESAEFARKLSQIGVLFVGPGPEILEQTGDKIKARILAESCNVPVLSALQDPTSDVGIMESFAQRVGFPIIIKAVDGGGGRGIRIVHHRKDLEGLMKRALAESPSGQVYAEKAAIGGFRHIEVQIIGDHEGNVRHLWERECSIQRRFQKVVEFTPSSIKDQNVLKRVIEAAVTMARKVNYISLGTFEFLVHSSNPEFYFLEVNPRLQVEHTITEMLCSGIDLLKLQLLIANRTHSLPALLSDIPDSLDSRPSTLHSIQIRITAEDVGHDWSLSVGKISQFSFPNGNGIRIETHLRPPSTVVSTDFDSLLAKLIITAPSWSAVISKARRALEDVQIEGVKTNLDALRGIMSHPDFEAKSCDTQWLESSPTSILRSGLELSTAISKRDQSSLLSSTHSKPAAIASTGNITLRPTDKFHISLTEPGPSTNTAQESHLSIDRIQQNNFPDAFSAHVTYTSTDSASKPFLLSVKRTTLASNSLGSSAHRKGDKNNSNHVVALIPGKVVEILVDVGDVVRKGEAVAVVSQMKMELEIRAAKAGRIVWVFEGEDGEEVGEGTLIAVVEDVKGGESKL